MHDGKQVISVILKVAQILNFISVIFLRKAMIDIRLLSDEDKEMKDSSEEEPTISCDSSSSMKAKFWLDSDGVVMAIV